jgi:hypothetical protein
MKRPVKKVKRFSGEEGSQVFSEAQEKWLGGADRTDPYILARMRRAVPDEPKVESKPSEPKDEVIDMRDNKDNTVGNDVRERAMKSVQKSSETNTNVVTPKAKPVAKPVAKTVAKTSSTSKEFKLSPPTIDFSPDTKVKNVSPELDSGAYKDIKKPETKKKPDLENGPIKKLSSPIKGPKPLPKFIQQSDKESRQFNNSIKNQEKEESEYQGNAMKKGGTVKRSSASKRADGCAIRGKTRA